MVIIFIIPLQYGDYLSDCRLPTPPITVCAESGWLCLCADPGAGGNCSCTKVPGQAPDCRGKKSPGCSAPGVADFKKKGLFIGYRGYEKQKITPAFCFGHGLSYSEFSYSNLQARAIGGLTRVSIDITNTGKLAGADTPQLYLGFPPSAGEPAKQLKGFNKTTVLAPGDKTTVTFPLRHRDLSIWSVTAHEWEVQKGSFVAMVGRSSCDLRANTTFESV
jgi:hypothetical protein